MWFKNLLIYRLTQDLPVDAQVLETALATKPARPCSSQEVATYGFVAPFGKGEDAPDHYADALDYVIYRIVRSDPDFMHLKELSRENIRENGYLNIAGQNV